MVKIAQMNFPPGYEALVAKVAAWFDNQIYPTWATRNKQTTRKAKRVLKEKTYMPSAAVAWKLLTPTEKTAWATAAVFGTLNRYQLFLADFSFRRKNGLSLPGTPDPLFEMMALELQNPLGLTNVRLRRDEKDLVGPIGISFTYQKTEFSPTGDLPFKFVATAYYFEGGKNKTETFEWSAPSGDVSFSQVTQSFGVSGRKYFHLTIVWYLDSYDAVVDLDHLLITGNFVDKFRENWQFKSGKTWSYDNLYRKTGWLFTPVFAEPYFNVLYLG